MRTTIDIDDPILKEVKSLGKTEGKPLGRIVSDLLADGLRVHLEAKRQPRGRQWLAFAMRPRIDVTDKDAVAAAMEQDMPSPQEANHS